MTVVSIASNKKAEKIAVIGSGISGMSCAWLLNQSRDVTLYEKDDRLGGHSNTVSFDLDKQTVDVDTGFIVFNPKNYPNLVCFFNELSVATCETDMSFGISVNQGALEYSGTGLDGLFAQKRNLIRPRFWSMLTDLMRFYRKAPELIGSTELDNLNLGQLLSKYHCRDPFIYDHLLPMAAAIWSTPVDKMMEYPARGFIHFCMNHGLLQLKDRPQWRTVIGGSKCYVEKIQQQLKNSVRLNTRIQSVSRHGNKVFITDRHGQRERYDHVVFACHSDQALKLLTDASQEERNLLACFPYQRNQAILHLDSSLMPKRPSVWSSWNYLSNNTVSDDQTLAHQKVSVTYWMNRLQPLNTETPVFVSLNPLQAPKPGTIVRSFFYDHPAFNQSSYLAQKKLWQLQGKRNTWFCGAYFGYGFHEDGLQSGLAVAEALGGKQRPWTLDNPNSRIHVGETNNAHLLAGENKAMSHV